MKVLELFAGTRSFSKVAEQKGHTVFTTDLEPFDRIDLAIDVLEFDPSMCPFVPDVLWASPPCESFSIASVRHHWEQGHRFKPKSEGAELGIRLLEKTHDLIRHYLAINPDLVWFVENPRGKMRKAPHWDRLLDHVRQTVTYCQYGDKRMKPTDIWTNLWDWQPRPMCKNGQPCHEAAPRGSQSGTQGISDYLEKSIVPAALCAEIIETIEMSENRFTNATDQVVFEAYRNQCEVPAWGSSRSAYLSELRQEMERRFDCSEIMTPNTFSLATKRVSLVENKIVVG